MADAATLHADAENLLFEGKPEGVKLLLEALDVEPTFAPALDSLETAAGMWPVTTDELLERLGRAAAAAGSDDERRNWGWYRLTNAAYHGRAETVGELLASWTSLVGDDADKRAAVGSLLAELGREDEAVAILQPLATPLGVYHMARLAARAGDLDYAREALAGVADEALRAIGEAAGALKAGSPDAARALVAARQANPTMLPPAVVSEMHLLTASLALAEDRRKDAEWAVLKLGMPPHLHDPSAMLRAQALLGPLDKVGR